MNASCCLCSAELTEQNDSEEHIIIAAIGGRHTVKGVLCRSCNQQTGTTWDAELARQLNPLSLFFRIVRQRRTTPRQMFETSGEHSIAVSASGLELAKPDIKISEIDGRLNIRVLAKDEDQARTIITGLKKRYPLIDVEASIAQGRIEKKDEYLNEFVKMEISTGGPLAGRSIVKSAYVLAVSSGARCEALEECRNYLLGESAPCFGYISNHDDVLVKRPGNTIIHCVGVQSVNGLLLGYVELFSVYRIFVCLSRNYDGPAIKSIVGINPLIGQSIDLELKLDFSCSDIDDIYSYKKHDNVSLYKHFSTAIELGMRRQLELERPLAIERAFKRALILIGKNEGDHLSLEEQKEFARLITEEMMPFIRHAQEMGFRFDMS